MQGSGADLLEHEGQYMQYHLLMVWRYLQDGAQALKVGGATGTNGKMPHNVDTALTHVDGRITEITRQLGDNLALVQQLKSETQTHAAATEDAITKLQHAVKELQDYYSDLALSVQTLQMQELQAKSLMPSTATVCQKAQYRDILECKFPIDALVTQFHAGGILVQLEYEEIRSTPNHMERNRKFFDYLFRKNDAVLARTLDILNQPQYHSYHYLGDILKNVFYEQAPHIQNLF